MYGISALCQKERLKEMIHAHAVAERNIKNAI